MKISFNSAGCGASICRISSSADDNYVTILSGGEYGKECSLSGLNISGDVIIPYFFDPGNIFWDKEAVSATLHMSAFTAELLYLSRLFHGVNPNLLSIKAVKNGKSFLSVKNRVTFFDVGPSFMGGVFFLIESNGKNILYLDLPDRDFRPDDVIHVARKNKTDMLLLGGHALAGYREDEGTSVSLEDTIKRVFAASGTVTFLNVALYDLERIVAAYNVCVKMDRVFVADIFTAYMLDRARKILKHIPELKRKNFRIKFSKEQAGVLSDKVSTHLLYHYNGLKIDSFEMERKKNNILLLAKRDQDFSRTVKEISAGQGAVMVDCVGETPDSAFMKYVQDKKFEVVHALPSKPDFVKNVISVIEGVMADKTVILGDGKK
ncbi:MAG TPA: hypothetical protein PKG81_03190, partial [Candidatus Omnitrophota bacterium]|nr:hypothetical protein [Candidatus Omnitrophota bacterium]